MSQIPLVPATFSDKSTLRQVRKQISDHLSLRDARELAPSDNDHECNCALARAIRSGRLFKACGSQDGANIMVIHSKSVIDTIPCPTSDESEIIRLVEQAYKANPTVNLESKRINVFMGPSPGGANNGYVHIEQ